MYLYCLYLYHFRFQKIGRLLPQGRHRHRHLHLHLQLMLIHQSHTLLQQVLLLRLQHRLHLLQFLAQVLGLLPLNQDYLLHLQAQSLHCSFHHIIIFNLQTTLFSVFYKKYINIYMSIIIFLPY